MEPLKIVSLTFGISLGIAVMGAWLVSLALDPLERLRQRWVARERDAGKVVHA